MVKSHHLYHSSHSDRQSKHILKSQFVCRRVCPGWGALWWVSDGDAQTRAQHRPFIQNATNGLKGEWKLNILPNLTNKGVEVWHFHIFLTYRGQTIPIFQRPKRGSKLPHITDRHIQSVPSPGGVWAYFGKGTECTAFFFGYHVCYIVIFSWYGFESYLCS